MKENKSCVGGKYKPKKPPKRKKYGNSTDRARSAKSMQTKINPPGCGKRPKTNRDQELIAGGIEAEKHSWPWMASIRLRTYGGDLRHICGGSLITQRHTLTAAHCVIKNGLSRSPSNFRVVLGGHYRKRQSDPSLEEGIIIATPIALIIHKGYRENYDNDLAIMVLDAAVPINDFINIICLPTPPKYEEVSGSVTVIGWGYTSEVGSMSKTLREVTVRVIPTRRCQYIFRNWKSISRITDNMLCAGELSGEKDSCSHDSGGPLMKYDDKKNKWFEVGIVSFGYGCATRGYPGVYVRVSRFMPWIQQVVKDTARYSLNRKIPL